MAAIATKQAPLALYVVHDGHKCPIPSNMAVSITQMSANMVQAVSTCVGSPVELRSHQLLLRRDPSNPQHPSEAQMDQLMDPKQGNVTMQRAPEREEARAQAICSALAALADDFEALPAAAQCRRVVTVVATPKPLSACEAMGRLLDMRVQMILLGPASHRPTAGGFWGNILGDKLQHVRWAGDWEAMIDVAAAQADTRRRPATKEPTPGGKAQSPGRVSAAARGGTSSRPKSSGSSTGRSQPRSSSRRRNGPPDSQSTSVRLPLQEWQSRFLGCTSEGWQLQQDWSASVSQSLSHGGSGKAVKVGAVLKTKSLIFTFVPNRSMRSEEAMRAANGALNSAKAYLAQLAHAAVLVPSNVPLQPLLSADSKRFARSLGACIAYHNPATVLLYAPPGLTKTAAQELANDIAAGASARFTVTSKHGPLNCQPPADVWKCSMKCAAGTKMRLQTVVEGIHGVEMPDGLLACFRYERPPQIATPPGAPLAKPTELLAVGPSVQVVQQVVQHLQQLGAETPTGTTGGAAVADPHDIDGTPAPHQVTCLYCEEQHDTSKALACSGSEPHYLCHQTCLPHLLADALQEAEGGLPLKCLKCGEAGGFFPTQQATAAVQEPLRSQLTAAAAASQVELPARPNPRRRLSPAPIATPKALPAQQQAAQQQVEEAHRMSALQAQEVKEHLREVLRLGCPVCTLEVPAGSAGATHMCQACGADICKWCMSVCDDEAAAMRCAEQCASQRGLRASDDASQAVLAKRTVAAHSVLARFEHNLYMLGQMLEECQGVLSEYGVQLAVADFRQGGAAAHK